MSQMEDSLRRALDGGDARDPVFRDSIYAASERALERMLETRGADETVRLDQRARLAATIDRVEADYGNRTPSDEPADADADDADEGPGGEPAIDASDWDDGPQRPAGGDDAREPRAYAPDEARETGEEAWTPGGAGAAAPRAKRSPLVAVLAAAVFALLLAVLAYTIAGAVRGEAPATTTTTGSLAPAAGETEAGGALPALAWIDVFDGNDLDALATPNGGRIETVAKSDEREAVRVSAPAGGEGEVLLAVGAGIMRQISGHQVRIELTAGSPNAAMREFGIRCLAGDESFCDRQRFSTAMEEEAFVFDVAVPPGQTGAGSIAIGPGLEGTPNDIDVYALRLLQLD